MIYRNFSNIKSLQKTLNLLKNHKMSQKINMKSLKKSNIKSQYRNIFFGRFLALYFRNPLAGVAVS